MRQLETAQGRARSLGWHATVAGDPQFGHVYLDRIRAVRRHDVARGDAPLPAARQRERRGDPAEARDGAPRRAFAREAEKRVRKALATAAGAGRAPSRSASCCRAA